MGFNSIMGSPPVIAALDFPQLLKCLNLAITMIDSRLRISDLGFLIFLFRFSPPLMENQSMSKWSQLPRELLGEIVKRLGTQFDIVRLRSVCPSWRSSVAPISRTFSSRFVTLPNDGLSDTAWGFYLSRRTVFLLAPTQNRDQGNPPSWLIKIEDFPEKMHLLHPLSRSQAIKLPKNFPKVLDLWHSRVFELGQEFVLQYINYRRVPNILSDGANLYMEKVVCMHSDCGGNDFVLLTIHVSGKLAMFKCGDKQWTIIQDMPLPYDDVILFKGKFFAVDSTGRTVIVALSSNLSLLANPVFGGDKKIFVQSGGELLLVDMYLSIELEPDMGLADDYPEQFDCVTERTVRFKVFRLSEEAQKWDEVKNLGDRVLFLSDDCTFSASVSDLSVCRGNCIIFADNFFGANADEEDVVKDNDIGVFDLGNCSIAPLKNFPEYRKLFWPPPDWVTSTRSEVQDQFEQMAV